MLFSATMPPEIQRLADFGITDRELREFLSEVGEVVDAHVPTDRNSGRPRGFGFVRFATEEQAANCFPDL
jgi:RNA recognition motif-containing protein